MLDMTWAKFFAMMLGNLQKARSVAKQRAKTNPCQLIVSYPVTISSTPFRQRVASNVFVFGTAALTSIRRTKRLNRGVLQPCMGGCEI